MSYGSTPIPATGMSPLELIMSRRIKTTIPTHPNKWPNLNKVKGKMLYTKRSKICYGRRHGAHYLNPLKIGVKVRMKRDGKIQTNKDKSNIQIKTSSRCLQYQRIFVCNNITHSSFVQDFHYHG